MGLLVLVLAVVLGATSYLQFSSVNSRLIDLAEMGGRAGVEANLLQAISAYRIRLRSLVRDRGVSSVEMTMTLRCSVIARSGSTFDCPERAAFDESTAEPDWALWLTSDQVLVDGSSPIRGKVVRVSRFDDALQSVTIELASEGVGGSALRRLITLRLGGVSVFRNALTGNATGSLYINSRVFGDVAQYHPFNVLAPTSTTIYGRLLSARPHALPSATLHRPGWFWINEASPSDRSIFPVSAYPNDDSDQYVDHMIGYSRHCRPIPTETVAGFGGVEPNSCSIYVNSPTAKRDDEDRLSTYDFIDEYDGASIEWNFVRQDLVLPKLDPNQMRELSTGSIRARLAQIDRGTRYAGQPMALRTISARSSGHLILDGRRTPIAISGRVFVDGDVVLMGRVTGQGSIIARGSIFIPSDLTYVNPPPHFSGSETAIAKMADVSTNGLALATEMVGSSTSRFDRLALFSSNHVIIGNPFEQVPGVADGDLARINWEQLQRYTGATSAISDEPDSTSNLIIDSRTGDMLDVSVAPGATERCVQLPWQGPENCIPETNPAVAPHLRYIRLDRSADPSALSDRAFVQQTTSQFRGEAFRAIFEPNDWTLSTPEKNWISREQFYALATDTSSPAYISAIAKDSRGRRGMSLYLTLIPETPFQPVQSLHPDQVVNDLNSTVGAFGEISGVTIHDGVNAAGPAGPLIPPTPRSLQQVLRDSFQRCQESLGSNWTTTSTTPNIPDLGISWAGVSRSNHRTPPAAHPYIVNDTAQTGEWSASRLPPYITIPLYATSLDCYNFTMLDAQITLPGPSGVDTNYVGIVSNEIRVTAGALDAGVSERYVSPTSWRPDIQSYVCADGPLFPGPFSFVFSPHPFKDFACRPRFSYQTLLGFPPANPPQQNIKIPPWWSRGTGDFQVDIQTDPTVAHYFRSVTTAYWDPSRFKLKLPVKRVDAFLFANHFIGFMAANSSDRQLRVHGGMVAKDVFGSAPNLMGSGRSYVDGRYRTQGLAYWPILGSTPGLWIMQDPRFQFREDLFDVSFLSVVSAR